MKSYDSFTVAYVDLCRQVRDEYEFDSAPRGMRIKEKLGVQFRIKNPRDRLPMVGARNFSASYFVAETLWYLSGSDPACIPRSSQAFTKIRVGLQHSME